MASLHLPGRFIIVFITAALFSMLPPPTLQAEAPPPVSAAAQKSEATEREIGKATYYAKRYQNRRTSSGERYDGEKLTAAHSTLPLGTKVRVINLANRKEVIVTINDRCRHRSFPFIDLSRSAAQQLGFLGKGTARVGIIPLDKIES